MARLLGEIEYFQRHHHDLLQRMVAYLQSYIADPKVVEHLIAHALECGVEHTLGTLTHNPAVKRRAILPLVEGGIGAQFF